MLSRYHGMYAQPKTGLDVVVMSFQSWVVQRALIIGCGYTGLTLARRLEQSGVAVTGTRSNLAHPSPLVGHRRARLSLLCMMSPWFHDRARQRSPLAR